MSDVRDRATAALADDLDAAATRHETPCGAGTMVWRSWGSGGRPVVLFHGGHGSWAHWVRNVGALMKTRRVFAADLPGFGESAPPPRPEDVESHAAEVAAGMRRLPADAPFDVIGFSMGGVIGSHVAALAPDLVARLIIVGSGGLGTPVGHFTSTSIRGLEGEALRAAHRANLLSLMLRAPESADELALRVQARHVPMARVQPGPLVMPDKLLLALPRIRARVDAIWGEFDTPHPEPEVQAAVIRRFHPKAELRVVPKAGHWAMYEGAEDFNRAALELLDLPLGA